MPAGRSAPGCAGAASQGRHSMNERKKERSTPVEYRLLCFSSYRGRHSMMRSGCGCAWVHGCAWVCMGRGRGGCLRERSVPGCMGERQDSCGRATRPCRASVLAERACASLGLFTRVNACMLHMCMCARVCRRALTGECPKRLARSCGAGGRDTGRGTACVRGTACACRPTTHTQLVCVSKRHVHTTRVRVKAPETHTRPHLQRLQQVLLLDHLPHGPCRQRVRGSPAANECQQV